MFSFATPEALARRRWRVSAPCLMSRSLLLILLFVALLLELALAGGAFFYPEFTLAQFGVRYGPETAFLGYIVAWLLLFVSLVIVVAFWQVAQLQPQYAVLCYLLGIWWIGIGIGIYVAFGKPENLLLDSVKGLLLLFLTWRSQAASRAMRRY